MQSEQIRSGVVYGPSGNLAVAPPTWVEAAYYIVTVYAIMCEAWGIAIRMLGAAGLALLAVFCLGHLGRRAPAVHRALLVPFLCASTYLAIQIGFHGETVMGDASRPFVTWMLSLVIVQALMLRPGFLLRFALFAFGLGLTVLPYLSFRNSVPGVFRAGLERDIGIANPNDLAAWLGFCAVVFTIVGLETKRQSVRVASAAIGTASLLIVGLTVSRASLVAAGIGIVIAFRRTLKKGFFPLLAFLAWLWTTYGLGLFDQAIGGYTARGAEETGRLVAWPLVFNRFLGSPLIGVGASHIATWVPAQGQVITPHNSFLFFCLSSGIVPLLLFVWYWASAVRKTMAPEPYRELHSDQPFRLPLLVYLLLISLAGDFAFMSTWGIVTFSLLMSVVVSRRVMRVGYAGNFQSSGRRSTPRHMPANVPE